MLITCWFDLPLLTRSARRAQSTTNGCSLVEKSAGANGGANKVAVLPGGGNVVRERARGDSVRRCEVLSLGRAGGWWLFHRTTAACSFLKVVAGAPVLPRHRGLLVDRDISGPRRLYLQAYGFWHREIRAAPGRASRPRAPTGLLRPGGLVGLGFKTHRPRLLGRLPLFFLLDLNVVAI